MSETTGDYAGRMHAALEGMRPELREPMSAILTLWAQVEMDRAAAHSALLEIANADPVDMALDPTWSQRIARAALDA